MLSLVHTAVSATFRKAPALAEVASDRSLTVAALKHSLNFRDLRSRARQQAVVTNFGYTRGTSNATRWQRAEPMATYEWTALLGTKTPKEKIQMKRLLSTIACAAVLCAFGASAHASIPVKMAPAAQANSVQSVVSRYIVVIYVYFIEDLPEATQELAKVDQAAEFDRTT